MAAKTLHVLVRTRQGITFDGEAKAVSAFNKVGPFDILPEHANFVTMITRKVTLHKIDGKIEEYNLENGVLVVEKNEVRVFLGVSKVGE